jgi:hypothetical protein
MSGQQRREGAIKAMKIGNAIAKKLESKYNLEDIDVSDGENGKVSVFAVSDDFINMKSPSIDESVTGGYPYRQQGDQMVISEPMDDETKESMIRKAEKQGYRAVPNNAGGLNIWKDTKGGMNERIKNAIKEKLSSPLIKEESLGVELPNTVKTKANAKITNSKTFAQFILDTWNSITPEESDSIASIQSLKIAKQKLEAAAKVEDAPVAEILTDKSSVDKHIEDFKDSDAPQFKGKSKDKKVQMAVAAYLSKKNKK